MVTIEKGIPIPKQNSRRKKLYPFDEMAVGDSFSINIGKHKSITSCRVSLAMVAKKNAPNMKFVTSIITAKTVRIWRVK